MKSLINYKSNVLCLFLASVNSEILICFLSTSCQSKDFLHTYARFFCYLVPLSYTTLYKLETLPP